MGRLDGWRFCPRCAAAPVAADDVAELAFDCVPRALAAWKALSPGQAGAQVTTAAPRERGRP